MGTQAEKLKAILYFVRTGILCHGKIYFQRLILIEANNNREGYFKLTIEITRAILAINIIKNMFTQMVYLILIYR